jgi:hypothetical protein
MELQRTQGSPLQTYDFFFVLFLSSFAYSALLTFEIVIFRRDFYEYSRVTHCSEMDSRLHGNDKNGKALIRVIRSIRVISDPRFFFF